MFVGTEPAVAKVTCGIATANVFIVIDKVHVRSSTTEGVGNLSFSVNTLNNRLFSFHRAVESSVCWGPDSKNSHERVLALQQRVVRCRVCDDAVQDLVGADAARV